MRNALAVRAIDAARRMTVLLSILFAVRAQGAVITSSVAAGIQNGIGMNKVSDLSFGDIVSPTGLSTVNVNSAGTRSTSGPVFLLGGTVTPAVFTVGQAGGGAGRFWVQVPASVTITGAGPAMNVTNFNTAGNVNVAAGCVSTTAVQPGGPKGACPRADPPFTLRIGARLTVGTNQPPGTYSGLFDVTVHLW